MRGKITVIEQFSVSHDLTIDGKEKKWCKARASGFELASHSDEVLDVKIHRFTCFVVRNEHSRVDVMESGFDGRTNIVLKSVE